MSSNAVETLLEFLGGVIRREEAEQLLAATGNDIEAAVAAHFSALSSEPAGSTGPARNANSDLANLRSVLGPTPPEAQLQELLRLAGGSVEVAVDMYLDDPDAGKPSRAAGGAGGSAPAAPRAAAAANATGGAGPSTHRTQAGSDTAAPGGFGSSPNRKRQGRVSMSKPAQHITLAPGEIRGSGEAAAGPRAASGPLPGPAAAAAAARASGEGLAGGTAVTAGAGGTAATAGAGSTAATAGAGGTAATAGAGGTGATAGAGGTAATAGAGGPTAGAGGTAATAGAGSTATTAGAGGTAATAGAGGTAATAGAGGTGAAANAGAGRGAAAAAAAAPAPGGQQRPQVHPLGGETGMPGGLPPRAPRAAAQQPGAVNGGAAGTSAAGGRQGQQPPQQVASTQAGQQQAAGATAGGPSSVPAVGAGGRSANTSAATGAMSGGTAATGRGAGPSGAAAAAVGGAPAQPRPLEGPWPLLDGNLIASVKRTQGPYPVTPLLPLPQYRRPDGSLFLASQDEVPRRSPPGRTLDLFKWPMALGQISMPLEFDTRAASGRRVAAPPETQKVLLAMALDWLKEGKLATAATCPAPPAPGRAAGRAQASASQTGDILWEVEELHSGGPRLALCVSNKEFIRTAASRFPDDQSLRQAAEATNHFYDARRLRLGTTLLNDKLEKLLRLYQTNGGEDINLGSGSASAILVNTRILGPGLDPHKGVPMRVDVADLSSASGSDSDSEAERGGTGAGAADVGSDSDQESDVDDGAGARAASAGGKQKLAGRKRRRASKGRASGGARERNEGGDAAASAMPRGKKRSKDSGGRGRGKSRKSKSASLAGGGAEEEEDAEEEKDTVASPRARKRSRRVGPASPGAARTTSPVARPAKGAARRNAAGSSSPSAVAGGVAAADVPFQLSLEFFITHELLRSTSPPLNWFEEEDPMDRRGARRVGEYLSTIIHVLLEAGKGLFVGPDCDGAINTMDAVTITGGAQGRHRRGAGASAGSAGAAETGARSRGVSTAGATSSAPGNSGAGIGGDELFSSDEEDGEGVRDLDSLLDSIRPPSDLPQALVPPAVVAHPKPFQLQGLEWMKRREQRGDAVGRSLLLLHPAWLQVVLGSSGLALHVRRTAPYFITAEFFAAPVGGTCGGFLCDEMGLGKSLQTLMLIVSNPSPPGWAATPVAMKPPRSAQAAGGSNRSQRGAMSALLDPGGDDPVAIPTTLLVTPANLQSQWVEEIERHLQPGSIKWAIYGGGDAVEEFGAEGAADGTGAARDPAEQDVTTRRRAARLTRELGISMSYGSGSSKGGRYLPSALAQTKDGRMVPLHECDVVLVSYEVLRKELSGGIRKTMPLPRLGFWRIVLDEAQLVANSNSVAAQVVSSLYRRHAWVVTGTPISSSLNEVQGMCEFLSYEPFYHSFVWRSLIQKPYSRRGPMGAAAFRALLRGVMLRRSKAAVEHQLALPPCTRQELSVELSGVERTYYDVAKGRFLSALTAVKAANPGAGSGAGAGRSAGAGPSTGGPGGAQQQQQGGARGRPNRQALDDSRRPNMLYSRANTALVELRQCCCHPQIVRREAEAAGGGKGGKGPGRLSMRQIMAKMVSEAYSAYDQAVANLYGCRLQLAALEDFRCGEDGSGAGTSGANGGGEGAASSSLQLPALLDCIRSVMKLVSEPDLLNQAKARGADGTVNSELASRTAAFGGALGGMASVAPMIAAEQAKERKRRWLRLELDGLLLRCYIACLQAPYGTLKLLAAQANARVQAEAHQAAITKVQRASDTAEYRAAALVEAQTTLDDADEEVKVAAGGAEDEDGRAAAEGTAVKKAKERLAAAKRAAADSADAVEAAKAAMAVAEDVAVAADAAAAAALAAATPEVATAAAEVHALNEELMEIRGKLGLEHVDFEVAEKELRRSSRQQMELAAGGAGGAAGPSNGVEPPNVAVSDNDNDTDWRDDSSDSSDSCDGGGRRRAGAKRRRAPSNLVGGSARKRGKNQRADDSGTGGAAGGGAGTSGLLLTRGGSSYQEAIFRSEVAVRTFQTVTSKRKRGTGESAEETRLLQAVREKWHELQHLINQQAALGIADDVVTATAGDAGAEGAAVEAPAAGGVGSSGSGDGAGAAAAPPQMLLQQQQNQLISQQLQRLLEQQNSQQQNQQSSSAAAGPQDGGSGLGRGAAAGVGPPGREAPKEEQSCPICLDVCERRTITKCGHTFCTDCIHDIVQDKGTAPCPICRRQLVRGDLFDSVPEEEAEQDVVAIPQMGNAEYGAKVSALLDELARMSEEDPGSKALVFSSWGRLLRLVQEALMANGVRCASMVGGNPEARQAALQSFLHDPTCRVLLLMKSTSGGAAGLTLTVAHTAFMMEPAMNPGLEAQAAARICRLGQDRPTRVIRIIAKNTVEERVLAVQQHKQQLGDTVSGGDQATEAVDGSLLLRFFDRL